MKPRRPAVLALGLLIGWCGTALSATVAVQVEGVEPGRGSLYVALCQSGLSEAECRNGQEVSPLALSQRVVFQDVKPGLYAVAAYQDVDGNGRLDRTGLGLPLEPYGFSGDTARAGRPDFAHAGFALREPGAAVRVRLTRALPPR